MGDRAPWQVLAANSHSSPIEGGEPGSIAAQEHEGARSGAIHCITQQQPKV